jgi:hypothetical protein
VAFVPAGEFTGDGGDSNVSLVLTNDPPPSGGGSDASVLSGDQSPSTPAAVPEPTSLVLLASGLAFAARAIRARAKAGAR